MGQIVVNLKKREAVWSLYFFHYGSMNINWSRVLFRSVSQDCRSSKQESLFPMFCCVLSLIRLTKSDENDILPISQTQISDAFAIYFVMDYLVERLPSRRFFISGQLALKRYLTPIVLMWLLLRSKFCSFFHLPCVKAIIPSFWIRLFSLDKCILTK